MSRLDTARETHSALLAERIRLENQMLALDADIDRAEIELRIAEEAEWAKAFDEAWETTL